MKLSKQKTAELLAEAIKVLDGLDAEAQYQIENSIGDSDDYWYENDEYDINIWYDEDINSIVATAYETDIDSDGYVETLTDSFARIGVLKKLPAKKFKVAVETAGIEFWEVYADTPEEAKADYINGHLIHTKPKMSDPIDATEIIEGEESLRK